MKLKELVNICFAHTLNRKVETASKLVDFFVRHFCQPLEAGPGGHVLVGGRGLRCLLQPPGRVAPLRLVGAGRLTVLLAAPAAERLAERFVPRASGDRKSVV